MPLLETENLCFSYGTRPVLSQVDLQLRAGEIVALLGPNGSGKSTLLRALLGQLRASGKLLWEGRPVSKWTPRYLARRVAYLQQTPTWEAEQTVADVLRMGRSPYLQAFGLESQHDVTVVGDVARQMDLSDLLDRRLDSLSGGQRQRVFLGRCLVQEPKAMLLDEPNTYLDLRHQVELGKKLRELARMKNLSVLMASHDLNLAGQFADRLILLSEGKVVADGTSSDVLAPELLSAVYGLPMQRIEQGGEIYVFPTVTEATALDQK
jgi:iron complex transport system ATP-binding protein